MSDQSVGTKALSGGGWLDRFLTRLSCFWDVLQDVGRVLKYTRLSLLVTLLAGLALILVPQGQDLIVIHAEEPPTLLVFYPAIVFWAVNAWYWARATLAYGATIPWQETCKDKPWFGGRLKRVKWLVRNVPRLIGTGAFVMIAIAQLKAAFRSGLGSEEAFWLYVFAALSLALAVAFYVFTVYRRRLSRSLGGRLAKIGKRPEGPGWLMIAEAPTYGGPKTLAEIPAGIRRSCVVLTLLLIALFVLVLADPTKVTFLHPDVVFLISASLWIAPGTWLLFVSRHGDLPVLTILVFLAFVFSFTNDNHTLRRSDGSPGDLAKRVSPETALANWRSTGSKGSSGRPTLVMVATAGGGSRAAYWTASVLGTIQDLHPKFDDQLFGISGVSGGSLGAVVFRGLLTALPEGEAACEPSPADKLVYRACAKAILRGDFLSATLASMVLPDFVQRFLPWGFLPDRAAALEQSWEAAWAEAMGPNGDRDLLAGDFLAAWPKGTDGAGRADLPALFLNGTSVATGKRIVTSNLDVAKNLTDAFDFFAHWAMPIPTSTSANNSARFPVIGPAGTMHREATQTDPNELDRIVDGGYFENFGAATALDLLQRLNKGRCDQQRQSCAYDLVVIQISSDPDYPGVDRNQSEPKPAPERSPGSFAAELTSPVTTLLNTRTARGVLAAQTLYDWVASPTRRQAHFIEFRLDIPEDETDPPLGWVLSREATRTMDCQLLRPSNGKNFEELGRLLGFDPKPFLGDAEAECG